MLGKYYKLGAEQEMNVLNLDICVLEISTSVFKASKLH
jgi:hypothetical protein